MVDEYMVSLSAAGKPEKKRKKFYAGETSQINKQIIQEEPTIEAMTSQEYD